MLKNRVIEPIEPVKHTRPWKIILVLIGALVIAMTWTMDRLASFASAGSPPPGTDASYDQTLVAKGAWLAAIGNCNTCHTASNGRTFAGGRPLSTPFGTIYATNITPDRETGIGRWSPSDFLRAMHQGVDRDGRDL